MTDYRTMYECAAEFARSLILEANSKDEEIRRLEAKIRELQEQAEELRFNPNHDPKNGRFTSGNGVDISGGSGIIDKKQPVKISLQYFAEIKKEKFTKYALDPLRQPDKARAFREALGYTMDNYQELIDNISVNLDESELKLKGSNDHGQLYEYVMCLTGANGKQANVCTSWIIENGKTEPRLTSAYVTKKKVTRNDDN